MATLLEQAYDIFVKLNIDANDASLMAELAAVVEKFARISGNNSDNTLEKLKYPLDEAIKFRKTEDNLTPLQEEALKEYLAATLRQNIESCVIKRAEANKEQARQEASDEQARQEASDEQARQEATARMSSRSSSAAANSMFDSIKQGVPLKKAGPPIKTDPNEGKSSFAKAIGKRRADLREDSESEEDPDSDFDFDDPKPAKTHKKKTKTTKRSFTQEPNVSQAAPSAKQAKTNTASSTTTKTPDKIETQNPVDKDAAKKAAAAAIDKRAGDVKGILSSLVALTEKTLLATTYADDLSKQISASIDERKFDELPKLILNARQAATDIMNMINMIENFIEQNTKGFDSVLEKELGMAKQVIITADKEGRATQEKALYASATLSKNLALTAATEAAAIALKKIEAHAQHPNKQTMRDKQEAEAKQLKAEAEAQQQQQAAMEAKQLADKKAQEAAALLADTIRRNFNAC